MSLKVGKTRQATVFSTNEFAGSRTQLHNSKASPGASEVLWRSPASPMGSTWTNSLSGGGLAGRHMISYDDRRRLERHWYPEPARLSQPTVAAKLPSSNSSGGQGRSLCDAIEGNDIRQVSKAIARTRTGGFNSETYDANGGRVRLPLCDAVARGNPNVVRRLLNSGALPTLALSDTGASPMAIATAVNDPEIFRSLLQTQTQHELDAAAANKLEYLAKTRRDIQGIPLRRAPWPYIGDGAHPWVSYAGPRR